MNTAANAAHCEAALAELLEGLIADGLRPLARSLGHSHTTIRDWGGDLHRWSAHDLFRLADLNHQVRAAAMDRLVSDRPDRPDTIQREGRQSIQDAGALISSLMSALADGRISDAERRHLLPQSQTVLDDLRRLVTALERQK